MPSALAAFSCRPNSHPFQERHVYLDEPVKIGRSVARCRPAQNNATFDCKVLSRNHALVWFDHKTGKFYLQDTKSSNGTFINSQRLSRGSEESPPCEVLSGDFIQFGVDVTENTRKVTHGCVVSTIKLFLPDGMEARRRSDVIQEPLPLPVDKVAANTPIMYSQELFQLSQYLQEALHREQMLEQKLATLQCLLATTQEASESSWQALIDEDRLLSRLEVMGSQLQSYSKNQTENGMRNELVTLQEDKYNYEITAKESLRRVLQEKIEMARKLSEVERSLSNTEDECSHLKEMNERNHEELRELANKYNGAVNEIKDLTDKIKLAEGRQEELTQKGQMEKKELQLCIDEMEEKEQALQARFEALQADNDFSNERLTALQVGLEQLQEKSIKDNNSLGEWRSGWAGGLGGLSVWVGWRSGWAGWAGWAGGLGGLEVWVGWVGWWAGWAGWAGGLGGLVGWRSGWAGGLAGWVGWVGWLAVWVSGGLGGLGGLAVWVGWRSGSAGGLGLPCITPPCYNLLT
uniref:Sarcolemmal membrane-associated protein n=1 Tax=Oncorhynchus mykiss TaxID=8022 RepID=A0A8L0DRW3_ONCMY